MTAAPLPQSYLFSGLDGTLLVKRASKSENVSVCSTAMLNVRGGHTIKVPGTGSLAHHPDAFLAPSSKTYRHWRHDGSVFFCDVNASLQTEHPICLRKKIRRLEDELNSRGVKLQFGVEIEFIAAPIISHRNAFEDPNFANDLGMHRKSSELAEEVLDNILKTGEHVGLNWYSAGREFHPSQFEVSLGPLPANSITEQFLLAKEVISSEFSKAGWSTSFLPLPFNGGPGNGCHIHVSLESDRGSQAETARVASSLASDVKRYAGFFNPTVNSYRRLRLEDFNGIRDLSEDRHSMIRILKKDGGRLEIRTPDAMMNVYAAILVVLFSAHRVLLEEKEEDDFPFPENLSASITNLKRLTKFKNIVGETFYGAFLDMLEQHDKFYEQVVSPIDFMLLEPHNFDVKRK